MSERITPAGSPPTPGELRGAAKAYQMAFEARMEAMTRIVAEEREACAKLADEMWACGDSGNIGAAIRARGQS